MSCSLRVVLKSFLYEGKQILAIIKAVLDAHRQGKQSPVPELPLLAAVLELTPQSAAGLESKVDKPPQPQKSAAAIDLGGILDRWAEVLSRVKEYNHSLLSSLRLGRIVSLDGDDLHLAFPYNFHKENIEARKNRIVIEQVLSEIFNEKLKIKAFLERELPAAESGAGDKDLVGEALKVLGK